MPKVIKIDGKKSITKWDSVSDHLYSP